MWPPGSTTDDRLALEPLLGDVGKRVGFAADCIRRGPEIGFMRREARLERGWKRPSAQGAGWAWGAFGRCVLCSDPGLSGDHAGLAGGLAFLSHSFVTTG